jgi:hypothetical protein
VIKIDEKVKMTNILKWREYASGGFQKPIWPVSLKTIKTMKNYPVFIQNSSYTNSRNSAGFQQIHKFAKLAGFCHCRWRGRCRGLALSVA